MTKKQQSIDKERLLVNRRPVTATRRYCSLPAEDEWDSNLLEKIDRPLLRKSGGHQWSVAAVPGQGHVKSKAGMQLAAADEMRQHLPPDERLLRLKLICKIGMNGRLERSSSFSEDAIKTDVRPRSRPEGRKLEGPASFRPPPPHEKRRVPPPLDKTDSAVAANSSKEKGAKNMAERRDDGTDLISFNSPQPNKGVSSMDDLDAFLRSSHINNNSIDNRDAIVKSLLSGENLSIPPTPRARTILPAGTATQFTYPQLAAGQPSQFPGRLQQPSSLGFAYPANRSNIGGALSPTGMPLIRPGSELSAPTFQPNFQMASQAGGSTGLSLLYQNQRGFGFHHQLSMGNQGRSFLHSQQAGFLSSGPTAASASSSMVKSQSWSSDDFALSTSTPVKANQQHSSGSTPIHQASPPPPPPSLRSSVSSYSIDSIRMDRRSKLTNRSDPDSLIDLEIDEHANTTVSVLEEFDPLSELSQEAEDIYWSSRDSVTPNLNESFYDSSDPFSYMADRAEQLEQFGTLDDMPEGPPLPEKPANIKIGIVRPNAEVSLDVITKRKTAARNYENVVKKDAKFFQCLGLSKGSAVARDSEVLAFTDMVRELRRKFKADDLKTNPGLVVSPRLQSSYPNGTELKLIVGHKGLSTVQFTANVHSEMEQIIAKVLVELDLDLNDCKKYLLQVTGRSEYLLEGALADYEYVHHCYKFDRDVLFTLVDSENVERDMARTVEDDNEDWELTYEQISPLDHANTLSYEDLKTLLEFLQKEAERITRKAMNLATCSDTNVLLALNPKGMQQAVKAVCAKLGGVETLDLTEAMDDFFKTCIKFDKAKGNEDPAGRIRPTIVDEVGEKYAMVTFNKTNDKSFTKHAEEIEGCLRRISEKVYALVRTYARTFRVDFSLEQLDSISPGELKYSTSVFETILIRVGCVHRVDPSWDCKDYKIDMKIFHGTKLICKETHATNFKESEHTHQSLHPIITFDHWMDIRSIPVSKIPLEARLVFSLVGRSKDPENKDNVVIKELGWAGIQLYDHQRLLSQGPFILAFWPVEAVQQIGPAPDSGSHPKADTCPLLSVEMLDLGGPVEFPVLNPIMDSANTNQTLDLLDPNTREYLTSLCDQNIVSFHSRPAVDREVLWEKRHYLRQTTGALPKILLSARSWDPDCLIDLYGLLETWPRPNIIDTLQLLLPIFPDSEVRRKAVEWLEDESSDTLAHFLPQLIEAVKHETWSLSPLVRFLLKRCLSSPSLTHSLYWLLTQSLPGISPQNSEGIGDEEISISVARHKRRLQMFLRALFVISGSSLRNRFLGQQILLQELDKAASAVKSAKDSSRHNILLRHMENLHHQLLTVSRTLIPLSASLSANGVDVKNCSYFNSNTFPLKVVFNSAEEDGNQIEIIYKVGDDLRQDMLTVQIIRVMDRLWLKAGLDLRMVCFSCVPTGFKAGIVEFVDKASTMREIQVAEQGVTGTFRPETLNEWLQKHNPSQLQFRRAVTNFTRSCAGYSVVTYILGICDRHNDNIMLKTSGHLFHIDFGKFLGDAQKFGTIKRDRVPFVLTPDMVFVINGGKAYTEKFHTFVELCCKAFNHLRREGNLILTMFALMASSGIPGVTKEAVDYVHERLLLDLSNEEAAARFAQLIHESINSSFSTQLNFFVHNLAQLKFSKDGASGDLDSLSFIPNKYSLTTDGKITEVVVHGIQKRYDPDKHYVFILRVARLKQKDPTYIFRTYKQFCEFHSRLCTLYPMVKFHSLTRGYTIRSNVKDVAEKRKREICEFLRVLFNLNDEVAHSDIVYTFFHPLLKDQEETSIHIQKLKEPKGHQRKPSVGRIKGRMKLSVRYSNEALVVMIYHVENLSFTDASREEPNAYVKVYLHPDPTKQTKRKTKVVKKSCNPTFMEMLEYRIPLEYVKNRTLQASVWDSNPFQENMFLGSVVIPLETIDIEAGCEGWYDLAKFYR